MTRSTGEKVVPPSSETTTAVVSTNLRIGDGLGPYTFPNGQSGASIPPQGTVIIQNDSMGAFPAGSYVLNQAVSAFSVPDATVTIPNNLVSMNLMTNLLQNTTHSVTYISPTYGPYTNVTLNGGSPPAIQSPGFSLPIINATYNPTVTFTMTMSGSGYTQSALGNSIEVGMYQGPLTFIGGYTQSSTPMASFDWGTSIPVVGTPINPLNLVTTFTIPIATYQAGNFAPGWDLALSGAVFFMDNLNFRVSITYNA
jgi:hypothetical protein